MELGMGTLAISQVLMILSTRGSAFQIISEEISYVKDGWERSWERSLKISLWDLVGSGISIALKEVRPPYGPEEQPVADANLSCKTSSADARCFDLPQ